MLGGEARQLLNLVRSGGNSKEVERRASQCLAAAAPLPDTTSAVRPFAPLASQLGPVCVLMSRPRSIQAAEAGDLAALERLDAGGPFYRTSR